VTNLISAIEASKEQDISRLIFALGIPFIGTKAASILAKHFGRMEKLQKSKYDELIEIPEIGEKMAESIISFFKQEQNNILLERLKSAGVNMESLYVSEGPRPLENTTFVLTGTLEKYTRKAATEIIENLGGKVTSNVSKKTDYVVVGDNPGSKYKIALELGIKILSEDEF